VSAKRDGKAANGDTWTARRYGGKIAEIIGAAAGDTEPATGNTQATRGPDAEAAPATGWDTAGFTRSNAWVT